MDEEPEEVKRVLKRLKNAPARKSSQGSVYPGWRLRCWRFCGSQSTSFFPQIRQRRVHGKNSRPNSREMFTRLGAHFRRCHRRPCRDRSKKMRCRRRLPVRTTSEPAQAPTPKVETPAKTRPPARGKCGTWCKALLDLGIDPDWRCFNPGESNLLLRRKDVLPGVGD